MKTRVLIISLLLLFIGTGLAGENISRLLYVYVPACESCHMAEKALEELQGMSVDIEMLDASADSERVMKLFEAYSVPDDERRTPIVFYGDFYLSGAEEICEKLANEVSEGRAIGGRLDSINDLSTSSNELESTVSIAGTAAVGLVSGFNPCALSMLLLFLAVVLQTGKKMWALAAAFMTAKFITYLLIGFLLIGLMQAMDPHWLQPLSKWILTLLGVILAALNLRDAFYARKEEFGRIRNQLPARLRSGLRKIIQKGKNSKALLPVSVLLGVVVAAGEFICAGQLYLIRLLAAIQAGQTIMAVHLIVYCFAFLLPSAIITVLIAFGKSQLRLSEILAEKMYIIKIVTALTMIALIAAAWLI